MQAKKSKGFTVIELMVTVVVLAILAAVALPSLRDMVQRFRVKGAADAAIALLGEARTGAVKAGRDVNASVTGSDATWCIGAVAAADPAEAGDPYSPLAADDTCDCTTANECKVGAEEIVVPGSAHPNVTVGVTNAVVFDGKLGLQRDLNADGLPDERSLAEFTSPNGTYKLRVRVSPGGMPNACVPSGPAIPGYSSC